MSDAEGGRIVGFDAGEDEVPVVLTAPRVYIGQADVLPTMESLEDMTRIYGLRNIWRTRPPHFKHTHYEATISTSGWMHYELKFTAFDEVNWARFERRQRRRRGYNPETPARSAMHAAYRGKTRRRGRK